MKHFSRIFTVVIAALLLLASAASAASLEPLRLTADERYAVNLFLSNFTEIGVDEISTYSDDMDLVDFAHDHLWFNDYDSFEYGDYFYGNNCRVSNKKIQKMIDKYFYDSRKVDLNQTRFDYDGKYYYHVETGGWINDGFAQAVSVCPLGGNKYFVSFMIFGGGEFWENDVLLMSLDKAASAYGAPADFGHAVVYAKKLADRSTYKLISFSR